MHPINESNTAQYIHKVIVIKEALTETTLTARGMCIILKGEMKSFPLHNYVYQKLLLNKLTALYSQAMEWEQHRRKQSAKNTRP